MAVGVSGVAASATVSRTREGAYGDLVGGLLDARQDLATERFDAELAAAEAAGRIDAQTARVLRWWQRESLRSLVEHARGVVPPALAALEVAAGDAQREVESSARAWARAATSGTGAESGGQPAQPTDLTARRRRLLVAGLRTTTPSPTFDPPDTES